MAWDKTKPNVINKLEDDAPAIQANFEAIELGTDPALLITNDKISPTANIADTKLAQIATANKVNGSALAGLDNIPSGAGTFPAANLPSTPGSKLTSLSGIPSGAGVIPAANLPADNVKTSGDQSIAGVKTFTSIPVLPASDPTSANQAVRMAYVDLGARVTTDTVGNTFAKVSGNPSSSNFWYVAQCDGVVEAVLLSAAGTIIGYTDANSPPTTARQASYSPSAAGSASINLHVRKGEKWLVRCDAATPTIYWLSKGSGGCVRT